MMRDKIEPYIFLLWGKQRAPTPPTCGQYCNRSIRGLKVVKEEVAYVDTMIM